MDQMQMRDMFLLVAKQLQQGGDIAERASAGDFEHTTAHRTAAHLLGVAAYVDELMSTLQTSLELGP